VLVRPTIVIALICALASTVLVNFAYLREHDSASALPPLSLARPWHSVRLLLGDRAWLIGFAMESGGFALFVLALALAPLALVQSVGAGGIGLLAIASARLSRRRLTRREGSGALTSVVGLLFLALSLIGGGTQSRPGSLLAIGLWLAGTVALAGLVLTAGRQLIGAAAADGVAGGLLFSTGDISTKVATQGGVRVAFAVTLIAGYVLGTSLLQIGYQRGAALTIAGVATLLTNVLPIVAGTVLFSEPVPHGALGALRVLAFVAVIAGAILLVRPGRGAVPAAHQQPEADAERPGPGLAAETESAPGEA
jgi:drug/metabolite transporter (DMT)-like permease